jgi:peptide/nickel transport system permease protein
LLEYIVKKFFNGVLVLAGVITVIFFLFNIIPADPAKMMMGQQANEKTLAAIRKELGTDKPLSTQFLIYINDLSPISFHSKNKESATFFSTEKYGSSTIILSTKNKEIHLKLPYLRKSYQTNKKVSSIIAETLPATFLLAFAAMGFATSLGIIFGIFAALQKDTFYDRLLLFLASLGMSGPSFFVAIIFAWLFAFVLGDYTGLNLSGSILELDDFGEGVQLQFKNLILPAFTLGIRPLAVITQLMRNSLLDVLSQDYIRTAKAKGLNNYQIIVNHALKNSLAPIVTAVSGWFASLMAGAVFIEFVFGWKGIGKEMLEALDNFDLPVVMGAVLVVSTIFVFINALVDIIYGMLDPRVRIY